MSEHQYQQSAFYVTLKQMNSIAPSQRTFSQEESVNEIKPRYTLTNDN